MNKKKGIIIGAFALILTMVIGYALFAKEINIKGTATVSGNFDLSYTCEVTALQPSSTNNGTCQVTDNTITTKSTLNKPDEDVTFKITITNNGTIPAVLKTVDSPNNFAGDAMTPGDGVYLDQTTFLVGRYFFDYDMEGDGDSAVEQAGITIEPGNSIDMWIFHAWLDSSGVGIEQPKLPEEGATIDYNVTLGFQQAS